MWIPILSTTPVDATSDKERLTYFKTVLEKFSYRYSSRGVGLVFVLALVTMLLIYFYVVVDTVFLVFLFLSLIPMICMFSDKYIFLRKK
jgi:hypothetical protein